MKFNPYVAEMFMWKWTANIYAWRARRAGYLAKVVYEGRNWLMLGGRWSVKIDEANSQKREKA